MRTAASSASRAPERVSRSRCYLVALALALATTACAGSAPLAHPHPNRSSKRGIAYGEHTREDLATESEGIAWWTNWAIAPEPAVGNGAAALGVEFVPMIWGGDFDPVRLAVRIPAGAKYLLTFNEPNFASQANLTPAAAAALWPKVELLAGDLHLQIVSPAVNYCGGQCNETDPFRWLDQFFAACPHCRVDYVAAHWYACDEAALAWYLGELHKRYAQPIWLTEFSCLDSLAKNPEERPAQQATYLREAVELLEADPRVFRYAWFTGRSPQNPVVELLGSRPGQLTELGKSYLSLPGQR